MKTGIVFNLQKFCIIWRVWATDGRVVLAAHSFRRGHRSLGKPGNGTNGQMEEYREIDRDRI